jgi:hypothetical protein
MIKHIVCAVFILVGITTLINLTDVSDLDDYERCCFRITHERRINNGK